MLDEISVFKVIYTVDVPPTVIVALDIPIAKLINYSVNAIVTSHFFQNYLFYSTKPYTFALYSFMHIAIAGNIGSGKTTLTRMHVSLPPICMVWD